MSLEGNPVLVKKKLFVSDCDDVEWRYKKINNFKYWLLYISVWSLLIFVVYCRITTQPEKQDSAFYGMCSVASSFQNFKLTLQNFVVTNIKQAYHFAELMISDTLLALGTGITVSLFTWMIIYLDSCQPGIQPPSPLSPRKIRASSGHTFHTGYILALVNGVLFSALALIW